MEKLTPQQRLQAYYMMDISNITQQGRFYIMDDMIEYAQSRTKQEAIDSLSRLNSTQLSQICESKRLKDDCTAISYKVYVRANYVYTSEQDMPIQDKLVDTYKVELPNDAIKLASIEHNKDSSLLYAVPIYQQLTQE